MISSRDGSEGTKSCYACELIERRDRGGAPRWDRILRTAHWDVAHAYNSSLEGWTVVVLRRHVRTLAELTEAEAAELGPLILTISRALPEVVPCTKTYVAQFADDPAHPHVHVHVVPKPPDLPDDERGPRVFARLGVEPEARISEDRMNEIADVLAGLLIVNGSSSADSGKASPISPR